MRISDWSSDVCSSDLPFAGGSNAVGPRRQSDTPLIPHAALSWRPGGDSLVYLSAGKGFRGGGTNGAVPANGCAADLSALGRAAAPDSYGSDSLWRYEAGVQAGLPDRRLRLSLAETGRAASRARGGQLESIQVVAVTVQKKT